VRSSPPRCPKDTKPSFVPTGYEVTLPNGEIDRLKAMRAPSDSYSDVYVRVESEDRRRLL
jgi:hypothetical protein